MGDRASASVTFAASDFDHLESVWGGFNEYEDDGGVITATAEEMNYGGSEEARESNVPLYGQHDAGDDYPGMLFCVVHTKKGYEYHEHEGNGDDILVPFNLTKRRIENLADARAFARAWRLAKKQVEKRARCGAPPELEEVCNGCGRPELTCSRNPCEGVLRDREATV